jgi:PKD repeat protein
VFGQDVLVDSGAVWKYLDDGSDQDSAWRAPGFDDDTWTSGPAQLGYGDGDEATVLGYGSDPNNKYITYYFRHSFNVVDPSGYVGLYLRLLRDDGAVVYLNGDEIERSNMPGGAIDYLTLASSTVSDAEEDMFFQTYEDPADLVAGTNVLAVEIHQRSGTSSDISLDLQLVTTTDQPPLARKAPYLIYNGDNTQMQVLWQLISTNTSTIEWGTDTFYTMGSAETYEYGTDHQHTYTITDLTPGTKYFYRVTVDYEVHTGSFHAAPETTATAVKFLAYGDTRTYPEDHDLVAAAMVATYAGDPDFQSFILMVGDFVSDGDQESDWDDEFFDPSYPNIQEMLATFPYQGCMGNHEESGVLFVKYFPYPFVDARYWSFDYGPAHFVVVDQYVNYGPGSTQLEWIEDDLASTTKQWKFICLHEPGWSAGGGHGNNSSVQNYIQPLCLQYGVTILFAGHNHYYARAQVNGVQHVTTGGGGAPLREPDPGFPYIVTDTSAFHFCAVEIDGDTLRFAAVSPDGDTLDSFTTLPAGGPPTVDFSGQPTSGYSPLNVQFTDESIGAITSWKWYFGDGDSSDVQNPSHVYAGPGQFEVTLTATGPGGSDSETKVDYITVSLNPDSMWLSQDPSGYPMLLDLDVYGTESGELSMILKNAQDSAHSVMYPMTYDTSCLTLTSLEVDSSTFPFSDLGLWNIFENDTVINDSGKVMLFAYTITYAAGVPSGVNRVGTVEFQGNPPASDSSMCVLDTCFYPPAGHMYYTYAPTGTDYWPSWEDVSVVVHGGICGDANGDEIVTTGDGYHILNYFGSGPPIPSCWVANVNGDGILTTADGYHILNYFGSGPALTCAPCE